MHFFYICTIEIEITTITLKMELNSVLIKDNKILKLLTHI